jgi:asparagine N-glycosylation enzyme membrane subunit Stt3
MNDAVDPWFNFRATKYLVEHGFYKFWDWFDDRMHLPHGATRRRIAHEAIG